MSITARNALIALGMTVLIILTVVYTVGYLDRLRISELQAMQHSISMETLSLETQFSLLETAPCDSIASSTTLSNELGELGERLAYTENQLGSKNAQVVQLKKEYYLLEIRDYLIMTRLRNACADKPTMVLYFYNNADDCEHCDKAGFALSYLRDTYPLLRVYSFDYDLNLGALKTLIDINKIEDSLPAFVINGEVSYGFESLEELTTRFPKNALK